MTTRARTGFVATRRAGSRRRLVHRDEEKVVPQRRPIILNRHREERSDEAIQVSAWLGGMDCFACGLQ